MAMLEYYNELYFFEKADRMRLSYGEGVKRTTLAVPAIIGKYH
jgi:hypothetical protein